MCKVFNLPKRVKCVIRIHVVMNFHNQFRSKLRNYVDVVHICGAFVCELYLTFLINTQADLFEAAPIGFRSEEFYMHTSRALSKLIKTTSNIY